MARISLFPQRNGIEFNSRSDLFDAFLHPAHGSYEALRRAALLRLARGPRAQ